MKRISFTNMKRARENGRQDNIRNLVDDCVSLIEKYGSSEDDIALERAIGTLLNEVRKLPLALGCWKRVMHGALCRMSNGKVGGTNWERDHQSDGCVRCGNEFPCYDKDHNEIMDGEVGEPVLCEDCEQGHNGEKVDSECDDCGFVHNLQNKGDLFEPVARFASHTLLQKSVELTAVGEYFVERALDLLKWPMDLDEVQELRGYVWRDFKGERRAWHSKWCELDMRYKFNADPSQDLNAFLLLASHPVLCPASFVSVEKVLAVCGLNTNEKYDGASAFDWGEE
jgi:hypothetical protein